MQHFYPFPALPQIVSYKILSVLPLKSFNLFCFLKLWAGFHSDYIKRAQIRHLQRWQQTRGGSGTCLKDLNSTALQYKPLGTDSPL